MGSQCWPKVTGRRTCPIGAGGAAADPGEGLAGAEPLERYVKEAKSLHREHVEDGAVVLVMAMLQMVGMQRIGSTPEPMVVTG